MRRSRLGGQPLKRPASRPDGLRLAELRASSRYPLPQSLTTTFSAPAASSLRRRREACESTVRVRIPAERIPHTSRRSSAFVKTRRGSLASFAASSNSRPASRTAASPTRTCRARWSTRERPRVDDVRLPEHRTAEQRPHAGEQLEVDVARNDVVGAALERTDASDGVGVGIGQDDDRHVPVPRAPGLAGAEPAAEIRLAGDHEIGRDALGEIERARRPGGAEHGEPVLAQVSLEELPRAGLVLGEEDGARAHPRRR